MDRLTIPNITFNTHDMTVSNTRSGTLSTFPSTFAPDTRPRKVIMNELGSKYND